MTDNLTSANRQIARAAGTVMFAIIISTLTGLARQILVADAFGTSADFEAFSAANRISEALFTLVARGALAAAFIPTFTGLLARQHRRSAWRLASAVFNLILLVTAIACLLAAVFAPQIVHYILAPGFAADPAKEALTISLARLMLPSAAIFSISGLVMGIMNAHQVFLIPALTPSMYQLGMIFGVIVLSPRLGIFGLAWGVLIGACLHLALQIPSLRRQKGAYTPTLGLTDPQVREVVRLMGPRLLGVAVVELNFWVNTRLASLQPEGSLAGIAIAFPLMLMPQAAIAQSIAIAAMPTFSAQVALGKLDEMRISLAASLRGALLLSIPASVGLMMLRVPIITLLYQRGEFNERSTQMVAWALLWYAAGLVGHAVVEILTRAFYAQHDTKTPVMVGAVAMGLNILLSVLLSAVFYRLGWMPHGGLALANSLATGVEMVGLGVLMRKRLGGLGGEQIARAVLQGGGASLAMALGLWVWMQVTPSLPAWQVGTGGVALGGIVFAATLWLLGAREARGAARWLAQRLPRRSSV